MAKVFPRQSQNFIFKLFFCFKSLSLSLSESNLHGSTPPYIYRSIRSGCTSMTTLCNNSIFRSRSGFGLYLIWVCVVLCFNMIYNFDLWLWFGLIWFLGLDYLAWFGDNNVNSTASYYLAIVYCLLMAVCVGLVGGRRRRRFGFKLYLTGLVFAYGNFHWFGFVFGLQITHGSFFLSGFEFGTLNWPGFVSLGDLKLWKPEEQV